MKRLILALVLVGAFVFGFAWERSEQKAHSPGSGASRRPIRLGAERAEGPGVEG